MVEITRIPLTQFAPIGGGRIMHQGEAAVLVTAPGQWHHSAEAVFELPGIDSGARDVNIRVDVKSGRLGIGWLSADGSDWIARNLVARPGAPTDVALTVPGGVAGGRLIIENATKGGRPAVAIIERLCVLANDDAPPPAPGTGNGVAMLDLDLDAAWTPDGTSPLEGGLPAHLQTPAAPWAFGLSVPIRTIAEGLSRRSARLQLTLGDIEGQVRVGIVSRDSSRFITSKIVDRDAPSEIALPVEAFDPEIGALIVQNVSLAGASHFTIRSIEWTHYPAERDTNLFHYMRDGFNVTDGWCNYLNIAFIRGFDELLFAHGIDGGICEIGVHHGKQFIALHNLLSDGARSIAIDVFGDQEFNLDGSGYGDYGRFADNLKKWGASPDNCLAVRRDSLSLRTQEIDDLVKQVGLVKFFGIDGCHEVEHTIADLHTAIRMTAHGGVIILDDYLNPDFPGVHQAIAYTLINDRPGIAPFLIGQNKLYLTQVSHHERYLRAAGEIIKKIPETDTVREVNLYGYRSLSWRTSESSWAFPAPS